MMEIPLWDCFRCLIIVIYAVTSAFWTWVIVRGIRPGFWRTISALPVILMHLLLPMLFDRFEEPFRVLFLSDASIMSLAKVLLLCLDRGPLVDLTGKRKFFVVFALPIQPHPSQPGEKKGEKQLVKPKERYSLWQYCMRLKPHLWLVLQTATMCFVNVIVLSLLARVHWTYHLHPLPRDAIVGRLIRDPRAQIRWRTKHSLAFRLTIGVCCTFFVSGLFHMLLLCRSPVQAGLWALARATHMFLYMVYALMCQTLNKCMPNEYFTYMAGVSSSLWQWQFFFTGWGLICVAERRILAACRLRGWLPPRAISIPFTLGVALLFTHYLFFPPLMASGVYERLRLTVVRHLSRRGQI